MSPYEINICYRMGLRPPEAEGPSVAKLNMSTSCAHKSFQEWFAAIFMAKHEETVHKMFSEEIKDNIRTEPISIDAYSFILPFICGFDSRLVNKISTCLYNRQIESCPEELMACTIWKRKRKNEQDVIKACIREIKDSEEPIMHKHLFLREPGDQMMLDHVCPKQVETLTINSAERLGPNFKKILGFQSLNTLEYTCNRIRPRFDYSIPHHEQTIGLLIQAQTTLQSVLIYGCDLKHTEVTHLLCNLPSITCAELSKVTCVADEQCGCGSESSQGYDNKKTMQTLAKLEIFQCTDVLRHVADSPALKSLEINDLSMKECEEYLNLLLSSKNLKSVTLSNVTIHEERFVPVKERLSQSDGNISFQNVTFISQTQRDVTLSGNLDISSGTRAKVAIRKHIFESIAWPAYDFSGQHIDKLDTDCCRMLDKCGIRCIAPKRRALSQRTVTLIAVGDMEQLFGETIQHFKDGIDYREIESQSIDYENVNAELNGSFTSGPVVFLAFDRDVENVTKLYNETGQIDQRPLIVLMKNPMSKEEDCTAALMASMDIDPRLSITTKDSILYDIDDLLERYAFDVVYSIATSLQGLVNAYTDIRTLGENVSAVASVSYVKCLQKCGLAFVGGQSFLANDDLAEHLQQLADNKLLITEMQTDIMWLYHRSNVPKTEQTVLSCKQTTNIDTQVLKDITAVDNVVGCGKRNDVIHIYLDRTKKQDALEITVKHLKGMLPEETAKNLSIHYASKGLKLYYEIGARIGESPCSATLGAFAWKRDVVTCANPDVDSGQLCVLMSKHVANIYIQRQLDLLLHRKQDISIIGRIIEPLGDSETLDIAAAMIDNTNVTHFDTRFKDEYGKPKQCVLFNLRDEDINTLSRKVYIWGAGSRPGRGIIRNEIHYLKDEETGKVTGPYVTIEDLEGDQCRTFCKPGDSGSIVCATDRRREKIYAICMFMGENADPGEEKPHYLGFSLQDGLRDLSQTHNQSFILCT